MIPTHKGPFTLNTFHYSFGRDNAENQLNNKSGHVGYGRVQFPLKISKIDIN